MTDNQQLLDACRNANFGKIKVFVDAGADVNCRNASGNTTLTMVLKAVLYARPEQDPVKVVKYLLEKGADIEMPNRQGVTPLMAAAARDNAYEVLLKLIDSGANINARDKSGQTALRHAVYRENDAAATALIEAGALVDQSKIRGTPY